MRDLWQLSPHEVNTQMTPAQIRILVNAEEGWRERTKQSGNAGVGEMVSADEFLSFAGL